MISAACGAWRSLVSVSRWPPGRQPLRRRRGHPPQHVEPVRAAVERHPRLVQPGLGGQQPDLPGRYVRHVGREQRDPAAQRSGQRRVEIALVHVAAGRFEVAAGAGHRCRIDVAGVHLGIHIDRMQRGGQRGADRAGAAAQIHHDERPGWGRPSAGQRDRPADHELGAAPGHEHPRRHRYPQAAELGPADHLLQRQPGRAPVRHGGEIGERTGGGDEQPGLVLGEHTASRPKPGDQGRPGLRRRVSWHMGANATGALPMPLSTSPKHRRLVPEG